MLGKSEKDAQLAASFVILYQVLPNLQKTDIFNFDGLNENLQQASFSEIYDNNKREAIDKDKNLRDSKNFLELNAKLESYCGDVIQSRRVRIMQKHYGIGHMKLSGIKDSKSHWILSNNGQYLIKVISHLKSPRSSNSDKTPPRIDLKDISQVNNFKSESFTIKIRSAEAKCSYIELVMHFRNDQICKAWFYGLESIIRRENIIVDDEGREELHQLILNEIQVRLMTLDLYSLEAPECTANVTPPPPDPLFD
ncbi:DgyrCDS3165 [Dimorphilus gyrociliatus]|uniref:DgyrCDS3165 n=1 Tax=Dimorphilus gyrociliatus TaxID=2664684 RepID=A0A7I8VCX7_9ANNE|nr:DgyrCDS3165 [Dimorphilus gyrociliatus]